MQTLELAQDVFADAARLRQTYQRLLAVAMPRIKKGKIVRHPESKKASRVVTSLDRELLNKVTPEVFRELLLSEVTKGHKSQDNVVTHRLLTQGGQSLENAKRLAHLFVQTTLFWVRPANAPEAEEVAWCMLQLCWIAKFLHRHKLFDNRKVLPIGFEFLAHLIKAAHHNDQQARQYLRLMHRAMIDWGFDLQPKRESEYTNPDYQELMAGLEGGQNKLRTADNPVPMAVPYSEKEWPILDAIRKEDDEYVKEKGKIITAGHKQMRKIPREAYVDYLASTWDNIGQEVAPHLVLSGGRDKVEVTVPFLAATGLCSFAFVREHPTEPSSWRQYPEVGVNLFWEALCEHHVTQITLTKQGEMDGFKSRTWPNALKAALWCLLIDAYAQIVLQKPASQPSSNGGSHRHRSRRKHHASDEAAHVHPHFRKLAEGWEASEEAVDLSIQMTGHAPAPGYTFVNEFDRSFPGYAPPSRTQADTWAAHKRLKAVLVYDEKSFGSLLEHIRSFAPASS